MQYKRTQPHKGNTNAEEKEALLKDRTSKATQEQMRAITDLETQATQHNTRQHNLIKVKQRTRRESYYSQYNIRSRTNERQHD